MESHEHVKMTAWTMPFPYTAPKAKVAAVDTTTL